MIKLITPDEVTAPKAYAFDKQELRPRGDGKMSIFILRTCLDCGSEDWVKGNSLDPDSLVVPGRG